MFLSSILSGLKTNLKQSSSFLGLVGTATFATIGSAASYYLFKGVDNKKQIEKLSSELKENRNAFLLAISEIKRKGYVERMKLGSQEVAQKLKNACNKEEMENYNKGLGYFSITYKTSFERCEKIVVRG